MWREWREGSGEKCEKMDGGRESKKEKGGGGARDSCIEEGTCTCIRR